MGYCLRQAHYLKYQMLLSLGQIKSAALSCLLHLMQYFSEWIGWQSAGDL